MFIPTRHFSPTKAFVERDAGLALILNPKVLSTTSRKVLVAGYREIHGRNDPSEGRYRGLSIARRFPTAPVRDYLDFILHQDRYVTYAFVRNPFARLASAWRNKFLEAHMAGGGDESRYPRSVRQRHLKNIRQFASRRGLAGGEPETLIPFDTFLRYAADRPEGKRDHHWDAQTRVLMTDRIRYERVFRFETELVDGFVEVLGQIGFPPVWVREKLAIPNNPSRVRQAVYTEELAALARPLCQSDLDHFGYDPEGWKGI